MALVTI